MPRGWLLGKVIVNPPDAVLCAEFERLQLTLDLGVEQEGGSSKSKRAKTGAKALLAPTVDLCDQPANKDTPLDGLEFFVDKLSQPLVKSVEACFTPSIAGPGIFKQSGVLTPKTGNRLPQEPVKKLKTWLESHYTNIYPTKEERLRLLEDTGLTSGT
jgi:hypothetical protein